MSNIIRSIRRKTARANMEKAGLKRVAKPVYNPYTKKTRSYFQDHWRKWVKGEPKV